MILNDRYVPMYEAGFGGTAKIFASFDRRKRELVAIKRIFPQMYTHLKKKDSVLLEESSLRNIDHPNVLRFTDRFWHDGAFCMVTEFIWGLNMEDYLYRRALSEALFRRLAKQMLSGLLAIHQSGFLHGDIKPQNMMIHYADDGGVSVKILDFGLADVLPDEVRFGKENFIVEELFATPEYVAPELISGGTPSELSDLYSLGQTFFHCLTGDTAFQGPSPEETAKLQVTQHPPSIYEQRSDLSPALASWIDHFLVKSPKGRWRSAETALRRLEAI
ncbi:MAG: serine/threonine-protein kinase [Verrucomicrobiota bacterium]